MVVFKVEYVDCRTYLIHSLITESVLEHGTSTKYTKVSFWNGLWSVHLYPFTGLKRPQSQKDTETQS